MAKEKTSLERKLRYQRNPLAFFTEMLDVQPKHVWSKMKEVCESVRDNPLTAVGAGHSVSKTYSAGRLALWFLLCYPLATVITTAPTHKQVEELLWRELRSAYTNAKTPLGGKLTRTKLDFQEQTGKKWFALGFSTKPDTVTSEATAFQGYHNEHILVIFDEAAGIVMQIWKAAQHLLTAGLTRMLVIGNPTSPTGEFAEALEPGSKWNVINISVKDTPNFKEGREVIPGLAGREYEEDIRTKYGEESNEYKIRILGQKPDYSEQTFFGKELAQIKKNNQIGFYPHEQMSKVYTIWDTGDMYTVIWFVQFIRKHIRIIDFYYDSKGRGLPTYAALLQQKAGEFEYVYARHVAPWDVAGEKHTDQQGPNAKSFQTGQYTSDIATNLGIPFHFLQRYSREVQIRVARDVICLCEFHEPMTEEGIEGLYGYRKKLNPALATLEHPVYLKDPVKDWTEHVGSSFCYLAAFFRFELEIDDEPIGFPNAIAQHDGYEDEDGKPFDALRHGLVQSR